MEDDRNGTNPGEGRVENFLLSENAWRALILLSSAAVLLFSVYCLSHSITIIFMHLYYFPIVLLAYRYRYRGFALATLLSLAYVGLVVIYQPVQAEITGAIYRFVIFICIAAVIAWLSERLASAHLFQKDSHSTIQKMYQILLSENVWRALILLSSAAVLLLSVYCLSHGITIIFMHLYYFPIVLLAYRYRYRGFALAILLSLAYVGLVIIYHPVQAEITGAIYRFVVFIGIAAVVAYLSERLAVVQLAQKQRLETIQNLQQFQESVITNANDWIMVLALNGVIVVWNDAAEMISGYKREDVVGKKSIWSDLYPDREYRKKVTREIRRIIEHDTYLENFESEIHCADGAQKTIIWNARGIHNVAGSVEGYIAIGRESEERYRALAEALPDQIFIVDKEDIIKYVNPSALKMLRLPYTRVVGALRKRVFPPDIVDAQDVFLKEVFETGEMLKREEKVQSGTQEVWLDTRFVPLKDKTGNVTAVLGVARDITEHKDAETELRRSFERFRTVMDSIDALVYVVDMETYTLLFINKYGKDIWGDIEGKVCWQTIQKGQAGPCPFCTNDRLVDRNGNPAGVYHWEFQNTVTNTWYDCRDTAVRWIDGRLARLEIATDITRHKQTEEQLQHFNEELEKQVAERTGQLNKSLEEKDVLFKEVHHRVKNNMQIIISLLNLQSRSVTDPVVAKVIRESQTRIKAMALVHERLYKSGDISRIDLKDYFQFLARELFSFYGVKSQIIRFTVNAPVINVNLDTAIPLGLMVNELISNAIKYAFPEGRKGEIVIGIAKEKNEITLVVRDDGAGIPGDFDWRNAKSLGLRLVNSLVGQLQGTIELDRTAGTTFTIVVKEKE